MHSLNQWKPKSAMGASDAMREHNRAKRPVALAFARLFVLFVVMAVAGLCTQGQAWAQNTITITPNVNFYNEGDSNPITGTVSLNTTAALMNSVTVNIRLSYQTAMAGDVNTSTAVVFTTAEANTAKAFAIDTANDRVNIKQRTLDLTATGGGATATANITQIDPRGVFLSEVASRTSESDPQNGARTFLDVSLVDPNNPSANLAEIAPTGNVFVALIVANTNNTEFSDEALLATDDQPIFQRRQVLTFTPQNFQQSQRVFVQGVDDTARDGDQLYRVIVLDRDVTTGNLAGQPVNSSDPEYNGIGANTAVFNVNVDNESNPGGNRADVLFNSPDGINPGPTTGFVTNENGLIASFTVVLAAQPTADVTINLQTSDPTEGKLLSGNAQVNSTSITFSPDATAPNGWNTPQTVRVKGQDDTVADGDIDYSIVTTVSSLDSNYAAIDPSDIGFTNNDNETPGLTVSPNFLLVFEGQSSTITAVLNRQPTADVRFPISVTMGAGQVQLNRTEVVFTPANFNVPQTVVVTGVNDNIVDGDQNFTITFGNANSSDPSYNGKFGTSVTGLVIDTNQARVNIQPPGGLTTTEAGAQATFSVSLASKPQPNTTVTINVTSSDTTEGTVDKPLLTFTPANYNVPQVVTITGVDDLLRDGNVDYQINLDIAGSSDPNYSALQLQPVTVTNNDAGEVSGITFSQLGGLTTTEAAGAGRTATFTVHLNVQPTGNVRLNLRSSDTTEGTVSPASIIFTPTTFNDDQTVTVTGVDDQMADGNVVYKVITDTLITTDTTYQFDPPDILVTNIDDDTSGINVTPTTGLVTNESGTSATFSVSLNSQPTADVSIGISTPFTSEISLNKSSLTFTTANWNIPQTVTVTGVDDLVIDGARQFVIVTAPATSTDPVYNGLNAADIVGMNTDNDAAAVVFSPNSLLVREGQSAFIGVKLSAQPTRNVVVPLAVDMPNEVVLDKTQLTFTPQNFNVPQQVKVSGIADGVADGNKTVTLTAGPLISGDSNFNNLTNTATITSLDVIATPGVTISGPDTDIVSENGGIAKLNVTLNSQPGADVTISISSSDTTEGTIDISSLTFTAANFNVAQTVTVRGVNDNVADGNIKFNVTFASPVSADPNYRGLPARSFALTNVDNDRAGFLVTPYIGLTTTEAGGTATFSVRLTSQPLASVTTQLSTPFTKEIKFAPSVLTFTAANWDVPQTVTVTGLPDGVIDGNRTWVIVTSPATSADPKYRGLDPSNVVGTNVDTDTFSIVLSPSSQLVREGQSVNVSVSLLGTPSANVVVPLAVRPTDEVVLDKTQLTFTPANANTPQTVKVTSLADGVTDGNVVVTISAGPAISPDARFNGLTASATVTSLDVIAVPAVKIVGPSTTVVNESGTTATFEVSLAAQPGADVTINIVSSDSTEGTVDKSSLTFTNLNFSTPQTVTVTGVDDFMDDGNVNFTVTFSKPVSTDPNYRSLAARAFNFVNVDDDTAGFTVTPFKGLVTSESGLSDTFTVVLNSQPSANVVINLSTPFTKEISFAPTSLVFTPVNWNLPQTVTVTGVDDAVPDGNRTWVLVTSPALSPDAQYAGLNPSDVVGVNNDNEAPGYTVTPNFVVVEEGNTSTFTVRLNFKPTAPVRVPVSVNRVQGQPDQVSVNTTALIFTPTNFSTPQTVTVSGIKDNVRDGDQPFSINLGNAISSDPAYNGQFARAINGTAVDTDVPGVSVRAANPLITNEVGAPATFTVALQTAPQAGNTVTINVLSTDDTEATVSPATLTFTPANFDLPQTVNVRGLDDGLRDGDQNYQIALRIAPTSDPDYVNVRVPSINAINKDNGGAGVRFTPSSGLTTSEDGTTATFSAQLINAPTGSTTVTVTLRSSDLSEGVLLGANSQPVSNNTLTLTFDANNTPQDITVQGVDDALVDGNVTYSITSRLTSTDPNFNLVGAVATLVNTDNDTAGITVTPTSGFVLAEGARGVFTVVLTTQPTGKVVVRLASTDTTEATVNYSAITFFPNAPVGTAPAGEIFAQWNRPVPVTITAVADGVTDGDQPWRIILSRDAGATQDDFYKTIDPDDVTGLTTDVNLPGVTVTGPTSITTSESDTKNNSFVSFSVTLQSKPDSDVVIPVSSSNRSEAVINVPGSSVFTPSNSLTFTPANFNVPKIVKVRGVDDNVEDGDQPFTITFGPTISRSSFYNGIAIPSVQGINKDDEDLTAPTVTITAPTDGAILNFLQEVTGTADDVASTGNGQTSGIASVKVSLLRQASTGLRQSAGYYNPTTKTYDPIALFNPAKHLIPARYNSATKAFSLLLPLTGTPPSLASGTYTVRARATDNKGNVTDSEPVTFVIDTIKPTVRITSPRAGTFSAPPQVQGIAQDNAGGTGISQTFVALFRAANASLGNTAGYLLPDGSFSDTLGPENLLPVVADLPGADGSVTFTFDFPALGAGQYTILAQTQDVAGNIGKSSTVTFTLRNVSGVEDFLIGQTYLFSLPYANNSTAGATVRPDEAFNVAMFDPVTNDQRYLLSRFNPLTSSYETLDQNSLLRRGEGYLIKPLSSNVRILRPTEDDSRIPLAANIRTWVYTLRRNGSASANDPNNGFNLIGDPFNPDFYLAADWQNATFSDGVNTYQGVDAAAAAGLVDSRLFTLNSATGAFEPVAGNIQVFKGYFVRTFKDNVTVTANAVSIQQ